ncbi:L-ascorbate metabolism protein UlaG (beta-lactamase superfamily) [Flavobacterium arsenatis]|uniref:L-ascorbate metabolism protein UlaG (Beta-lactamase superfamily) n=1 Tax=Flavobacterium arsenatis TaxID=1484332 RepID=A0ABU1TMJ1_9FLAO|nr:MBL fold metallo-hydrolase [Flavobacterium arsenatis]MDR6967180.1 L-ascorbate metabolism protein UlaG (beta-lactamase superfamily) [Flavobacterium arsenatis]
MIFLIILVALSLIFYIFLHQKKFGRKPSANRTTRILNSPNFKEKQFQNLSHTPSLAEGVSMFSVLIEFIFKKKKRNKPSGILPSAKTDLLSLSANEDVIVWFGHSSYFLQIDGKKILVDPVFSGAASPIKATTRSFKGSDVYTTDDIPEIDYLFISHDHWDHLDYETVLKLKPKIKTIICGLGVAEHLELWGFNPSIIIEKDWYETINLADGFVVSTTPARHFSGRGFKRNQSLWMSFVLKTPSKNIFLGGDSGYDFHFKEIGDKFGPFDLAVMECGQYDKNWKYIHLLPEHIIPAAKELQAKKVMPVHWGKFALANHDWDEPIIKISEYAALENVPLITPMIGEKVNLKEDYTVIEWWKNVD